MRFFDLLDHNAAASRYLEYLTAITGTSWDQESYSAEETWQDWLELRGVESTDAGAAWLADAVVRALGRIDELGMRRCCSEEDLRTFGTLWAEGCGNTPAECVEVRWGPTHVQRAIDRMSQDADNGLARNTETPLISFSTLREGYEFLVGGHSYAPALGFFPFYLTPSRRRAWAVLPFGRQTSLALVGNAKTLNHVFGEPGQKILGEKELPFNTAPLIDAAQFATAVARFGTLPRLRFWYFGVGHAAFQIAMQVLETPQQHHLFREALHDFSTDVDIMRALTAEAINVPAKPGTDHETVLRAFRKAQLKRLSELLDEEHGLLISDLGVLELQELSEIVNEKKKEHVHFIRFDHGLDVQVGLGLSLCTMPLILRHDHMLSTLIRSVRSGLSGSSRAQFERHGISVINGTEEVVFYELADIKWAELEVAPKALLSEAEVQELIFRIEGRFKGLDPGYGPCKKLKKRLAAMKKQEIRAQLSLDANEILRANDSAVLEIGNRFENVILTQEDPEHRRLVVMNACLEGHLNER